MVNWFYSFVVNTQVGIVLLNSVLYAEHENKRKSRLREAKLIGSRISGCVLKPEQTSLRRWILLEENTSTTHPIDKM